MIGKPINQSIKLVNWYRLVSVNQCAIDNHSKIVQRLVSIGTGPPNKRHARYLSDHRLFLGSPGDKIGKTIPSQSSQCKEYTPLHVWSNVTSLPFYVKMGDSRKYPYLYHGRLFGFPKGRGGSRLRNSEGMGGYLRLEIRRHGGVSQVGFLE